MRGCACCPMLAATGYSSISCLRIPHRSPRLNLCRSLSCIVYRYLASQNPVLKQKNADLRLGDVRIPRCSGETCPRKDRTVGASGTRSGSCGRRPSCPIYGDAQRIYCVSWSLFLRCRGSCEECRARITSDNETSLLTHLFSLCLKVDDYVTDTALLAADLKMAPTRCDPSLIDRHSGLLKSPR